MHLSQEKPRFLLADRALFEPHSLLFVGPLFILVSDNCAGTMFPVPHQLRFHVCSPPALADRHDPQVVLIMREQDDPAPEKQLYDCDRPRLIRQFWLALVAHVQRRVAMAWLLAHP